MPPPTASPRDVAQRVGFHGKLPCNGDFVHRRLPADFVVAWDQWLESSLESSRLQLGPDWRAIFQSSPVWRFCLSPGVCGAQGQVGIVLPSVDRVGRLFPIAVVRALRSGESPLSPLLDRGEWFDKVTRLTLAAVDVPLALDQFDSALFSLQPPPAPPDVRGAVPVGGVEWQALDSLADLADAVATAITEGDGRAGRLSYWWTAGTGQLAAGWCAYRGMPRALGYTDFLTCFGHRAATHVVPATDDVAAPGDLAALVMAPQAEAATPSEPEPPVAIVLESAATTHRGNRRQTNQDAFLDRADLGLWVVADGVGGGIGGDRASGAIREILNLLPPAPTLDDFVLEVRKALRTVNGELREDGLAQDDTCASTVVALLSAGTEWAVVWAGDSRLYRLRDGHLAQVTVDHSGFESFARGSDFGDFGDLVQPQSNVITRAVGAADELELEEAWGEVRPQDRYLLCSDGLYREMSEHEIAAVLAAAGDPAEACRRLEEQVLERAANDNVTSVVVFAR